MFRPIIGALAITLILTACGNKKQRSTENKTAEEKIVNLYTHRHYEVDKELYQLFEQETGIKVNVISATADELLMKLANEGELTPCDLFVTVDAARLESAKQKGLLQPIQSDVLNKNILANYRDSEGYWYAQTMRARVIAAKKGTKARYPELKYEDLAKPEWKNKVLMRPSENTYNQALVAALIAHNGLESTQKWVSDVKNNFARAPKGNDRDQIKDIAAGVGEITLVNTYYLGKMQKSQDAAERAALEKVDIIFPNQSGYGTHINISGAGLSKHAKHKENAIKLLEFLSKAEIQAKFASGNDEYPVNGQLTANGIIATLGNFKPDTLNLAKLGQHSQEAVLLFDKAGWK